MRIQSLVCPCVYASLFHLTLSTPSVIIQWLLSERLVSTRTCFVGNITPCRARVHTAVQSLLQHILPFFDTTLTATIVISTSEPCSKAVQLCAGSAQPSICYLCLNYTLEGILNTLTLLNTNSF